MLCERGCIHSTPLVPSRGFRVTTHSTPSIAHLSACVFVWNTEPNPLIPLGESTEHLGACRAEHLGLGEAHSSDSSIIMFLTTNEHWQ